LASGAATCVLGPTGAIRHVIYMQFDNVHYTRDNDHNPTMINSAGRMAPAPWVSYTLAGCNFGTVAGANTELETTLPDVALVYGKDSPEAKEAGNPKLQSKATADFMGLAVHCTRGATVCARGSRP
jgi:hypothetical protein